MSTSVIRPYREATEVYFTDEQNAQRVKEYLYDKNHMYIGRIFEMKTIVMGRPYSYFIEWRTITTADEHLLYERREYGKDWDKRSYFMYKS